MNSLKGSGVEHMKFLTFGTPLNKMKHPTVKGCYSIFQLLSFCDRCHVSCQFGTDQNIVGNYYKMNSIFNSLYHLISLRCCNISISLKIINLLHKKLRGYQRLGHFSIFV